MSVPIDQRKSRCSSTSSLALNPLLSSGQHGNKSTVHTNIIPFVQVLGIQSAGPILLGPAVVSV